MICLSCSASTWRSWDQALRLKVRQAPFHPSHCLGCAAVLSCSVVSDYVGPRGTPWTVARQAPLSMGILQARITGVDFHALSMTQGLNFGLLHWQVDSLPLSQQGSPGNLGMFGQMWCNSKFIIQVVFYMNANFLSSYCESESHSVVSNSL